ncbi:Homologous recombination OB-fold protein [Phytophthora ramorum]|uniref:Homologous recombination OB-fold protein n=1 Tax=Phytophthora ramorum TaxID=164328 RepID=UPI0030AE41B1|nr:Homologous recombination OB-fold protein [Phytophthora ramorum]
MSGSESEGKRRRNGDDDDLGSQQSILKWMRHVPGPLQDVMKKRADQLDNSQGDVSRIASATSGRYSVSIATVFDQGPWVDMCQYLGMATTPGKLYGDIKIGSLKCTIQNIVEDDEALAKVPQLLVLIKSVRYVDEEIVAILHDPTGEIEGYFHRELVEQLGPALVTGVGVLLYKVSIFTPTDAPVTGRRNSYLNITPRNVQRVFITKEQSIASTSENPVEIFNKDKEIDAQHESDNDDYDDNQASRSEQAARQLLQHSTVRDTSAELTFLSQRQVIHRNPPVRADPVATTTTKKKGKRGKGTARSNGHNEESGLGKWQWSKLLKKTADGTNDESAADSSRTQERRGFLDASSRLASLITKQNARNRPSSTPSDRTNNQEASLTIGKTKKSVSVRFAPGTMFDPPSFPRNSDNCDVTELTQRSPSLQPQSQSTSPSLTGESKTTPLNEEDEEDDDW